MVKMMETFPGLVNEFFGSELRIHSFVEFLYVDKHLYPCFTAVKEA
jgi:hypothetical protein